MVISEKLIKELQNRLKVGNRRGVHLNALPGKSRYKFDLTRLKAYSEDLPERFITDLLSKLPLSFEISWTNNSIDLNKLDDKEKLELIKISKSLENLIFQTNSIESEKGINTFGFGYPLLIRRDNLDNKLTVAPILIWSLKILRGKNSGTWIIKREEEDPIYVNEVLINHLQNDAQVSIDKLTSEHLDDGLIDQKELIEICCDLIRKINVGHISGLEEELKKKIKSVKPIPEKSFLEKLPLTSTNAFIESSGLFSIFEVQKQNIIQDYDAMSELVGNEIDLSSMSDHFFQPISSIDTDPSQQEILHGLGSLRNTLIQGPPGTGKSQSLTAILVNALENEKKTIVVCEKRTALEVLQKALKSNGYEHLCVLIKDIVKDRRVVVDSVRDRIDSGLNQTGDIQRAKEVFKNTVDNVHDITSSINRKHQKLDERIIGTTKWTSLVGQHHKLRKSLSQEEELELKETDFSFDGEELNHLENVLKKGKSLFGKYRVHKGESFLNSKKLVGENLYEVENKVKNDFQYYENERLEINEAIEKFHKSFTSYRVKQLRDQISQVDSISQEIDSIYTTHANNPDLLDKKKIQSFSFKFSKIFSSKKKQVYDDFERLMLLLPRLSDTTSKDCPDVKDFIFGEDFSQAKREYYTFLSALKNLEADLENKVQREYKNIDLLSPKSYEGIEVVELKPLVNKIQSIKDRLNQDDWIIMDSRIRNHNALLEMVKESISSKERFFNHPEDLFTPEFKWFSFFNSLPAVEQTLINQLNKQEIENWVDNFRFWYLNRLLQRNANFDLPTDDSEHEALKDAKKLINVQQKKFILEYWQHKQSEAKRKFENEHFSLSLENLYNKKSGKKHKRQSLRRIVDFDTDLFTTFFPIILTTPDVCSNLFQGRNQYFDNILFDEASQLKLEDNLPEILKGKQIVVAGDEHQMPPSNYFSKVFDGTADEEEEEEIDESEKMYEDSLLAAESLLDFAQELRFEKKHLDYHYRSKHPYLIDFSNYAFYKQRLKPFPNQFDYIPINFIQVSGVYKDNVNKEEARKVLEIIENQIHRLPDGTYPTIGVATFNINQRNEILHLIEERKADQNYKEFNDKILELEENGVFVKNLENIQGDERDVIILSTTYGVNEEGKFYQRFTGINQKKGYKLLNVIITRAKYKMYVCSSIPDSYIYRYREELEALGENNKRAAFYSYLAYAKAVSDGDENARQSVLKALAEQSPKDNSQEFTDGELESPFEEEVYETLCNHVSADNITIQYPFAEFRIDMVFDHKKAGVPKIAIECDGAKYHSSQQAYLHDQHRQEILENHGFVFHRIWSTNWWRNPESETRKLVDFILSVGEKSTSHSEDTIEIANAFKDHG